MLFETITCQVICCLNYIYQALDCIYLIVATNAIWALTTVSLSNSLSTYIIIYATLYYFLQHVSACM